MNALEIRLALRRAVAIADVPTDRPQPGDSETLYRLPDGRLVIHDDGHRTLEELDEADAQEWLESHGLDEVIP